MTCLFELSIALLITLLNGFFVMAEYSLVRIRKSRLDELIRQGKSRASTVLKMSEKLDTYLSATQLGITASSLLLGWFGGPLLAEMFRGMFGVSAGTWYDHSLVFACAFLIIVFLHVVFGELVPRTIALGKVEQVAMAVAYPLVFFHYLLYPEPNTKAYRLKVSSSFLSSSSKSVFYILQNDLYDCYHTKRFI